MEPTKTRRLIDIAEVPCPDSCNRPPTERGCHFRAGPAHFTCSQCQLRIRRHFLGYELTAEDLSEMLHGHKVTATEKTLVLSKNGKDEVIRARLMFDGNYQVRLAPKLKSREETGEVCPKCRTGKILKITSIDNRQWYGCSGFPACRYSRPLVPHTFVTALQTKAATVQPDLRASSCVEARPPQNPAEKSHSSVKTEPLRTQRPGPSAVVPKVPPIPKRTSDVLGASAIEKPAKAKAPIINPSPENAARHSVGSQEALGVPAGPTAAPRQKQDDPHCHIPRLIRRFLRI